MINNKILIVLIFILIGQIDRGICQNPKNYQKYYTETIVMISNEDQRSEAEQQYFRSLKGNELADAIAEISELGDEGFITHHLLPYAEERVQTDSLIIDRMLFHLSSSSHNDAFRITTISFLEKHLIPSKESHEYFEIIYEIANSDSNSERLRAYAISRLGRSNTDTNKKRIKEFLLNKNPIITNGASKAAKTFILSQNYNNLPDEWSSSLISAINLHQFLLNDIRSAIFALGLTQSVAAREYLNNLLSENIEKDLQTTGAIVNALSYLADERTFIKTFELFSQDRTNSDNYGKELILRSFAERNVEVLKSISTKDDFPAKITYLRSLRLCRNLTEIEDIEKIKNMLHDSNEEIRAEAVKTIHFILSHEDEVNIFKNLVKNEKSARVLNTIYFYIGRQD